MSWIVVAVAVLAIAAFFVSRLATAQKAEPGLRYKKLPALFTAAERSFLGVLDLAVGKDFRVFGKIRLADVLAPHDGLSKSEWQSAFNKISGKHFDYVLCSPGELSVLCAIELDDASHQKKKRHDRDDFIAGACRAAGVPLISFAAQHSYSPAEVRARITEAIAGSPLRAPKPAPDSTPAAAGLAPEDAPSPRCPRCSSTMIKRTAKAGSNAGQAFWGCSKFPACREMVKI